MIGLCVLMLVVLLNSYTTVYISYLTVSKFKPIVKSFEELAASKEYKIMQVRGSAFANFLMVYISLYIVYIDLNSFYYKFIYNTECYF